MEDYDYDLNKLQSEFDNYFYDDLIGSDGEENPDDDTFCNDDIDEDMFEIDDDISIPKENDTETLGQIILQIQGDFENSVLNDFSTTQLNLSPDQIKILECCQNSQLKRLILLNRLKAMHCVELAKRVKQAEDLCCGIIDKLSVKNAKKHQVRKKHPDDHYFSNICKLGFPYFKKTISHTTPKHNADYYKKLANHELVNPSFIEGRRWIHNDQISLYETVCKNYRGYRKHLLQEQLNSAKKAYGSVPKSTLRTEIKKLKKQLKSIENETEYIAPPMDEESGINWLSVINDLHDRHSAFECQSFWRIYLHPDINKKNWSKEENHNIHFLVKKYNFQNWDAIANELGTNRTGFLVIVHYFTKLCDKFLRARFSPEEDEQIINLVEEQRMGNRIPWSAIATHFIGRSKLQLYHRYTYYLIPQGIKKGNFTEAEDILLCYLIEKFGKDYTAIANIMKTRTRFQLSSRYRNHLETINNYNLLPFTIEDDREIMKHVEQHGATNWKALGDRLGKGRRNVMGRYTTIKKQLENNVELEEIRRSRKLVFQRIQSERIENLNGVLKEIRKNVEGIPTLKTVERYLERYLLEKQSMQVCKTYKANKPSVADQHLIEFFMKINQDQKQEDVKPHEIVSTDSLNRIVKLLLLLGSRETLFGKADIPKFPNTDNYDLMVEVKSLYKQKYAPKAGSFSFVSFGVNTIREILPPTICTMTGFQNLFAKCEEMQKNIQNLTMPEQCSFESLFSDEADEVIKNGITKQRNLFFTRLLSAFKWPIILSLTDPSEKVIQEERMEEDEIMEVPKILQAKSKKRLLADNSDEDECDEDGWKNTKFAKSDAMVKYYPGRVPVPIICDRKNQSAQCFFFLGTCPPLR